MKTRDLAYIALFTALLSVSAWVAVPIGTVPVTLQTLTLLLATGLLGWKRAFFVSLAYLLLGFIGVPVFSGFTGGAGALLSPTGGYLVGFLFMPLCTGAFLPWIEKAEEKALPYALSSLAGLLACYLFGTLWCVLGLGGTTIGFFAALGACVLPYLPLDIVKLVVAVFLILKLKNFFQNE